MPKKLHFIINPAAGQDYPVLSVMYRKLKTSNREWEVSVPAKADDIPHHIKKAIKGKADIVVAYGGDGTVAEVAKELCNTGVPLAIIPGGTANVLAKELMLPVTVEENLDLLLSNKSKIKKVDMGRVNDHVFILRINVGITADMVTEVNKTLKKTIGQLAYSIKAVQKLGETSLHNYHLTMDGKKVKTQGIALMIANSANTGLSGISIFPDTSISDGKLDVIVWQSNDLGYITATTAQSLTPNGTPDLLHWKAKQITLRLVRKQKFLYDDAPVVAAKLNIEVLPKALSVLVPK